MKAYACPATPMQIYFDLVVFCPNGTDHHEHVFEALDIILAAKPQLRALVFADQKLTELMKDFEPLYRVTTYQNIVFVFGVVSPNGLDITEDPLVYVDRRWLKWIFRVQPYLPIIMDARVLWAVALPQLFMLRRDAILSSVLFGPIIESKWNKRNDELGCVAREYIELEKLLMQAHDPAYINDYGHQELADIILERL